MNWLIFVVITLLSDSFRIYLDNYISDTYFRGNGSVSQKILQGAVKTIIGVIVLAITGSQLTSLPFFTLALFFLSGFLASFSSIPYYKALEIDDSTNLGIFLQLAPVLYLILGFIFFGETISPLQILAFVIILLAPLVILLSTRKRSREGKLKALMYAFFYVLIAVSCNLLFVQQNVATLDSAESAMMFAGELGLFIFGNGLGNMAVIGVRRKWRRRFRMVVRRHPRKLPRIVTFSAFVGIISDCSYRLAMALAPTMAVASAATDSVEPIVIFFMGIILTLISPKFGREQLNRKSILVHLGATVLVVIGVALIQIA